MYRNLRVFRSLNFRVKIFRVTLFSDVHHRSKIFLVKSFLVTYAHAYKGGRLSARIHDVNIRMEIFCIGKVFE